MHLTAIAALLTALSIIRSVYRYWSNPLRKIPAAHPLAPATSLWINYVRWSAIENATLKAAHDRLGPVVCLGPNEVSVNCVKGGIREIYAGGFEKSTMDGSFNWYSFFSNYGGVDNMFSTGSNKPHSMRKRMISNIYSKSVVTASPALLAQMRTIIYDRFLPHLASTFSNEEPGVLDIYTLLSASTMDIVTAYIFGLKSSSNLIGNQKQLFWFLDLYNSRRSFNFWAQELPSLTIFFEKYLWYRLVPKWVYEANGKIEEWTKGMCESAAAVMAQGVTDVADTPVVYGQLASALKKEAKKSGGESEMESQAASEVLDHLAAGFDTSGITLTYVIHELCRNPEAQARLQQELLTLLPPLLPSSNRILPDGKAVDALPFLHAVIWETLRLHPAIPGPQPRVSPAQGCRLGPEDRPYHIPGGVRVSASAGLLHLNEDAYPQPTEWKPERWLSLETMDDEKRRDMESRWFWAFGSGGRMCVGSHLAVYQMKYVIAALYSNYTTSIVDDTGIEQVDAYTAPPRSDKLLIRLQKLNAQSRDL